ncbi:MAG: flagellar hook-length control protein FliK, partial [Oscillospiraceae bacterium]|nr:flagellar hook-length control protein FliK [Oscillospiraceae bacterium]
SGQVVQENAAVQDSQAAEESLAAEETKTVGDLSLKKEDENSSDSALDVILNILESTEDNGTLKGMKILAKAVLNAMMGDSGSKKKKTDLFAFMGEGYDVFADDYNLFLTGTEMLSQIGIALKTDLMAAEEKAENGLLFFIGDEAEEDFISPIDEIISKLDKIVKKLYSADDDETDETAAAEMLAAMLDIPADTDLDYVLTPVKEQAVESAADVLTSAKEIVAAESPEDVPKMEQLYSELTASVKSDKPEAEQSYGVHEAFNVSFAAVKINNAADQLKAINGEEAAAAVVLNPTTVQIGGSIPETETGTEVHTDPVEVEEQITEKISERLFDMKEDNGTEELIMVLKPENLGQVAIKLVKENGAVSVLLSAQYEEVGKLMAERAANLGSSLQSKDVQVKDINVVDPSNAAE